MTVWDEIRAVQVKIDELRAALVQDAHAYIDSPEWTTEIGIALLDVAEGALKADKLFDPEVYRVRKRINREGNMVKTHEALVALAQGQTAD